MLEISHVTKQLSGFSLNDITMTVPDGYIMGLIGQNGAGKTTLLEMIFGLYRADSGTITVDGKDIAKEEREGKDRIGYVFSQELFLKELTLEENAKMYGRYYSQFDLAKFKEYCVAFDIPTSSKLKSRSKGEKLKFQLAFALSHSPKLLILDEPFGSFDSEFLVQLRHILTGFVADGKHSVIIATHIMTELSEIADYVTMMAHGRVVFSMEKEELMEKYKLVSGEAYKIALLPKERVIYKEEKTYGATALVIHNRFCKYDKEVEVAAPTLEELMYYMVKGEKR